MSSTSRRTVTCAGVVVSFVLSCAEGSSTSQPPSTTTTTTSATFVRVPDQPVYSGGSSMPGYSSAPPSGTNPAPYGEPLPPLRRAEPPRPPPVVVDAGEAPSAPR